MSLVLPRTTPTVWKTQGLCRGRLSIPDGLLLGCPPQPCRLPREASQRPVDQAVWLWPDFAEPKCVSAGTQPAMIHTRPWPSPRR